MSPRAAGSRLCTGAVVEVLADTLDPSGAGVATVAETRVRVADLLPGERARARVEHVSPHRPARAWAAIVTRSGPLAAERVQPSCPAFGACGGCVWQHVAYEAQLSHKVERVRAAFEAHLPAGVFAGCSIPTPLSAPRVHGYRNVGKYVVSAVAAQGGDPTGRATPPSLVLGSYAPRSHRVVDTSGCAIVAPVIDRVQQHARRALRGLPVYRERARSHDPSGGVRYLVLRQGYDDRVLAAVVTTGDVPRHAIIAAAERLGAHADVAGVVWVQNDSESAVIFAGTRERVYGSGYATERVADVSIAVEPGDFFQVNRAQAARMYHEIARMAGLLPDGARAVRPVPARIVDLYCGVGSIGFTLARAALDHGVDCRVLGIERNPSAVRAAQRAALEAGLGDIVSFRATDASSAADIAALVDALGGAPDLVVVNPPRKGLGQSGRDALCAIAAPAVIYVSCGPDSLARDLADLIDRQGYAIDEIHPVDLMPGTPQIETLVALRRHPR